jgi:plasmid stabilization system protein ParE
VEEKAARDDLAGIADHIAADNPATAERFLDEIMARIAILGEFPFAAARCPYYPKARQLVYGNYLVYYTVSRRDVMIRAIVHGARLFRVSWLRRK